MYKEPITDDCAHYSDTASQLDNMFIKCMPPPPPPPPKDILVDECKSCSNGNGIVDPQIKTVKPTEESKGGIMDFITANPAIVAVAGIGLFFLLNKKR